MKFHLSNTFLLSLTISANLLIATGCKKDGTDTPSTSAQSSPISILSCPPSKVRQVPSGRDSYTYEYVDGKISKVNYVDNGTSTPTVYLISYEPGKIIYTKTGDGFNGQGTIVYSGKKVLYEYEGTDTAGQATYYYYNQANQLIRIKGPKNSNGQQIEEIEYAGGLPSKREAKYFQADTISSHYRTTYQYDQTREVEYNPLSYFRIGSEGFPGLEYFKVNRLYNKTVNFNLLEEPTSVYYKDSSTYTNVYSNSKTNVVRQITSANSRYGTYTSEYVSACN